MDENEMIVDFEKWCPKCKYEKLKETVMPCFACLDEPVNMNTTKPIRFEAKGE